MANVGILEEPHEACGFQFPLYFHSQRLPSDQPRIFATNLSGNIGLLIYPGTYWTESRNHVQQIRILNNGEGVFALGEEYIAYQRGRIFDVPAYTLHGFVSICTLTFVEIIMPVNFSKIFKLLPKKR